MPDATQAETHRPKRDRSPSYPGIDLEDALRRAGELYKAEKQHSMPFTSALSHWGFGPSSSQGQITLAALKKFGLIDDEGLGAKREVRLTKETVGILVDEREDSTERQQAIQRAALMPAIHKTLWERYGATLPSDATLKHWLKTGPAVPFTDRGIAEFIPQYKRTIAFAGLTEGGKLPESEGDKPELKEDAPMLQQPPAKGAPGTETVRFPIRVGVWGQLQVPTPMSEDDWQRMLKGIEAQKLGLVAKDEENEP